MDDDRWDAVRLAMYALDPPPRWRTKDVETRYVSEWDREWYYHFRVGGYRTIEWLEIMPDDADQRRTIMQTLDGLGISPDERSSTIVIHRLGRPMTHRVLVLARGVVLDKPLWRSTDGPALVQDWPGSNSDLATADAPSDRVGTPVHPWWGMRRDEQPMDWTHQADILTPNGAVSLDILDLVARASGDVDVRLADPPGSEPRGGRRRPVDRPMFVPYRPRPRRDRFSLGGLDLHKPVRVHVNYKGFTSLFSGGQTLYGDYTFVLCLDDGQTEPGQLLAWGVSDDGVRVIDLRKSLH